MGIVTKQVEKFANTFIYIYIYIERERERNFLTPLIELFFFLYHLWSFRPLQKQHTPPTTLVKRKLVPLVELNV